MTETEFVSRMIGIPWRLGETSFEAVDCYGLCEMYWREVLGIEVIRGDHSDLAEGLAGIHGWRECHAQPGSSGFMTWVRGAPTHCGVLVHDDMLLHAQAGRPVPESGSVRLTRLSAVRRVCSDIRFYRYEPC